MQNISTHMLVVAVALIGPDGSVLLQRRAFDAVHGGLWEFPGGKVETEESPETALVREIAEELGLDIDERDLEALAFASGTTAGQSDPKHLVILLYTCRTWRAEPQCAPGAEIGWFVPEQIASLAMPPLDYPLAHRLARALAVT